MNKLYNSVQKKISIEKIYLSLVLRIFVLIFYLVRLYNISDIKEINISYFYVIYTYHKNKCNIC